MSTFQKQLIKAMEANKISQTELSKRTGITKASISQYVNGVYDAKQNNLFLLAQALHCTPAYLMGLEDSTEPAQLPDADLAALPEDEKELMADYRKLNPSGKDKVREYTKDLSENDRYTENPLDKLNGRAIG